MPRDLQCGAASDERFMIASSGDYKKGLSGGMTGASYICIICSEAALLSCLKHLVESRV